MGVVQNSKGVVQNSGSRMILMVMRMRMMMICVVITCSVHEDDDHVGDDVKSVTNDKKIAFYLILLEQLAPSKCIFFWLFIASLH